MLWMQSSYKDALESVIQTEQNVLVNFIHVSNVSWNTACDSIQSAPSYRSIGPRSSHSCCHHYLFACRQFTSVVYVNSCRLMRHCISNGRGRFRVDFLVPFLFYALFAQVRNRFINLKYIFMALSKWDIHLIVMKTVETVLLKGIICPQNLKVKMW